MLRSLLKTKINGAIVTETELHYEGSITVDEAVMERADIISGEEVWVLNVNNGARFVTYCIKGKRNSGTICINGAGARLAQIGDKVLILTFCSLSETEIKKHRPRIVHLDKKNRITKIT